MTLHHFCHDQFPKNKSQSPVIPFSYLCSLFAIHWPYCHHFFCWYLLLQIDWFSLLIVSYIYLCLNSMCFLVGSTIDYFREDVWLIKFPSVYSRKCLYFTFFVVSLHWSPIIFQNGKKNFFRYILWFISRGLGYGRRPLDVLSPHFYSPHICLLSQVTVNQAW